MTQPRSLSEVLQLVGTERPTPDPRHAGRERRAAQRFLWYEPIDVQPLTEALAPCGERRRAITRDISARGLGLYAYLPPEAKFLRAWLAVGGHAPAEVLLQIVHRSPFLDAYNIWTRLCEKDPAQPVPERIGGRRVEG